MLFLAIPLLSFGQSQLARLKFEQAEESFNGGHYEITLAKLDEIEEILGASNPKVLHLRILAAHKIVGQNLDGQFPLLQKLRTYTAFFLENYKAKGLENIYNEVYKINENIASLPKTKEEILNRKKIADDTEKSRIDKERKKLLESRNYIASIEEKYRFKKGISVQDFLKENQKADKLLKSKGTKSGPLTYYNAIYKKTDPYPIGPYAARVDEENQIVFYVECLFSAQDNDQDVSQYFIALKNEVEKNVDANYITYENDGHKMLIAVIGTEVLIEIDRIIFQKWQAVTITFK